MHLKIFGIEKKKVVFWYFNWYYLVQNGRFSGQNLLQTSQIHKLRPCYGDLKFFLN